MTVFFLRYDKTIAHEEKKRKRRRRREEEREKEKERQEERQEEKVRKKGREEGRGAETEGKGRRVTTSETERRNTVNT